jgi:hypothetical protein
VSAGDEPLLVGQLNHSQKTPAIDRHLPSCSPSYLKKADKSLHMRAEGGQHKATFMAFY